MKQLLIICLLLGSMVPQLRAEGGPPRPPKEEPSEPPKVSTGERMEIPDQGFSITPPNGWMVSRNSHGSSLLFEAPKQPNQSYLPTIQVMAFGKPRYVDEVTQKEYGDLIVEKFGKLSNRVTNYRLRSAEIVKMETGDPAILYYTEFQYDDVPIMQMHILISSATNHFLMSYTDVAKVFEDDGGPALGIAYASMHSAQVASQPPWRWRGFVLAGIGVFALIFGWFTMRFLRARKLSRLGQRIEDEDNKEITQDEESQYYSRHTNVSEANGDDEDWAEAKPAKGKAAPSARKPESRVSQVASSHFDDDDEPEVSEVVPISTLEKSLHPGRKRREQAAAPRPPGQPVSHAPVSGHGMNPRQPMQGQQMPGMPQQGMNPQGMPQQGMNQQMPGMPQQGMNPQGMPQQGMNPQGMPQQGMNQQMPGMPQQSMNQQMPGMPQQGMNQQMPGMPQQGMNPQGMPQQGMNQQMPGMPQQGMNPQGMPQQGMNQQMPGMPQQGMNPQGMPQQSMNQQMPGMPQQGMSPPMPQAPTPPPAMNPHMAPPTQGHMPSPQSMHTPPPASSHGMNQPISSHAQPISQHPTSSPGTQAQHPQSGMSQYPQRTEPQPGQSPYAQQPISAPQGQPQHFAAPTPSNAHEAMAHAAQFGQMQNTNPGYVPGQTVPVSEQPLYIPQAQNPAFATPPPAAPAAPAQAFAPTPAPVAQTYAPPPQPTPPPAMPQFDPAEAPEQPVTANRQPLSTAKRQMQPRSQELDEDGPEMTEEARLSEILPKAGTIEKSKPKRKGLFWRKKTDDDDHDDDQDEVAEDKGSWKSESTKKSGLRKSKAGDDDDDGDAGDQWAVEPTKKSTPSKALAKDNEADDHEEHEESDAWAPEPTKRSEPKKDSLLNETQGPHRLAKRPPQGPVTKEQNNAAMTEDGWNLNQEVASDHDEDDEEEVS